MIDEQKRKLAMAWYSEDWAIDKAVAMLNDCEAAVTAPLLDRIAALTAQVEQLSSYIQEAFVAHPNLDLDIEYSKKNCKDT